MNRKLTSAPALVTLLAISLLGVGGRCGGGAPQPFGQELLGNPGFETGGFAPWSVDYGSCEVEHGPSFPFSDAHSGDYLFYGGDEGAVSSCRASQQIDLLTEGFRVSTISGLRAGVDASAWMHNWFNSGTFGTFDDQIFFRIRYLAQNGSELGSLRTLIAGDDQWLLRQAIGLVPPGTRSLRAELEARFRLGADNDGFADDTSLVIDEVTDVSPTITKQPMLQDVRQDAMTVIWETDSNRTVHKVQWGPAATGLDTFTGGVETTQVDATHFVHKAVIPGLTAETLYVYRVWSGSTASPTYSFRTGPHATSPFRIAWFSDNQNGPGVLQQHVVNMAARGPDLVIVPGDLVQNANVLSEWQNYWFGPLETAFFGQTTPIMIARGNHDGEHALSYAYTAMPGNESWYAFSYGNTFFVAMDTETDTSVTGGDEDPLTFLQNALDSPEAQAAEFRVVFFHKPPYTNLWDATNLGLCIFGGPYDGESWVRNEWVPIFESKNVDLVVSGHTHSYQHGVRNGVHYVLEGGGGGAVDTFRGCFGSTFWGFISTEESEHHYNIMDVDGGFLSWTAYDASDQVLHNFSIVH